MRLTFEKGELKAVNDEKFDDPIKAIQKVEPIFLIHRFLLYTKENTIYGSKTAVSWK